MRRFIIRADNNKFTFEGEIVHCKDCKFCIVEEPISREIIPDMYCRIWASNVRTDDYCSYGERKAEREVSMSGDVMPKEQSDFIEGIQDYMLEASNMKEDEAWDFGFRIWQFQDWLKGYIEKVQLSPETSTNDEEIIIKTGQTYGKSANFSKDIICEQIKKHAERIKAEADKNPDSLWSKGMRSFDVLDDSTTSKTETVDTPTNTPTEDCISRQAAIDAVERALFKRVAKAFIESLPPVDPKPVCEDAISKHDLWRIVEDNAYWITYNETSKEKGMTLTGINQALNECPPVEPKRLPQPHKCVVYRDGSLCRHPIEACSECPKHEGMRAVLAERPKGAWIDCTEDGYVELPFCHSAITEEQTMRLIKLTSIEKRDIAIVADEVISIERGDYFGGDYIDWESEKKCDFEGRPTRIIMKNLNYAVREDFETVCALVEGADDE